MAIEHILYDDEKIAELTNRYIEHTRKASVASGKWQNRKEWLDAYIRKNIAVYQSDGSRRDKVKGDWALEDYMGTWNWHRREANRILGMIQMEAALRQMYPDNVMPLVMRFQREAERSAQ